MAGWGSWDRGCWPGRVMPMGLWAAAELRCIGLDWLVLIPVGKEKGMRNSRYRLVPVGRTAHRPAPAARGVRPEGEKPRARSGPGCHGHISGCWTDPSALGLVSLNDCASGSGARDITPYSKGHGGAQNSRPRPLASPPGPFPARTCPGALRRRRGQQGPVGQQLVVRGGNGLDGVVVERRGAGHGVLGHLGHHQRQGVLGWRGIWGGSEWQAGVQEAASGVGRRRGGAAPGTAGREGTYRSGRQRAG